MFCYEYAARIKKGGTSATAAAIAAGVPRASASSMASKWLSKGNIRSTIKKIIDKHFLKLECRVADVAHELAKIGYSNIDDFVNWTDSGVTLKSKEEIGDRGAAIREIRIAKRTFKDDSEEVVTTLRLHDKVKSLEILKNINDMDHKNYDNNDDIEELISTDAEDIQSQDAEELTGNYSKLLASIRARK
jgi:phage terminase small subunit